MAKGSSVKAFIIVNYFAVWTKKAENLAFGKVDNFLQIIEHNLFIIVQWRRIFRTVHTLGNTTAQ